MDITTYKFPMSDLDYKFREIYRRQCEQMNAAIELAVAAGHDPADMILAYHPSTRSTRLDRDEYMITELLAGSTRLARQYCHDADNVIYVEIEMLV